MTMTGSGPSPPGLGDLPDLAGPAGERAGVRRQRARHQVRRDTVRGHDGGSRSRAAGRGQVQLVAAQHGLVQLAERGPGLGAEFLGQVRADPGVAVQGLGRPSAGVQRLDEPRGQRLHQRMLVHEVPQGADHRARLAGRQQGLRPGQDGLDPLLAEPFPGGGHPVPGQPG